MESRPIMAHRLTVLQSHCEALILLRTVVLKYGLWLPKAIIRLSTSANMPAGSVTVDGFVG